MNLVDLGQFTRVGVQQALNSLVKLITGVEFRSKVSGNDTSPNYLESKVVSGNGVNAVVENEGANEDLRLDVNPDADGSIAVGAGGVAVGVLATDAQHGVRGGDTQHAVATPFLAGFMSASDKAKLDWLGSIERVLVVGLSGQVDYTDVKSAVDAATLGGATAATPWLIWVSPGTYNEDPITIQDGIVLVAQDSSAFVVANNPAADLFTCNGGYVEGLHLSGVTDAARCLVRCGTADTLTIWERLAVGRCSNGCIVENGANLILRRPQIVINGPNASVTTGFTCLASSQLAISGGIMVATAASLPFYAPNNPIQTCVYVSGGRADIDGAAFRIAYNDLTSTAVLADEGALVSMLSCGMDGCAIGVQVGASGANTAFLIHGGLWSNNNVNGHCASSTGTIQVMAASDVIGFTTVAGGRLAGVVQNTTTKQTLLVGVTDYLYLGTDKELALGEYFHEFGSTGLSYGGDVTDAGGLFVNVDAGAGYCSRMAPDHDIEHQEWDAFLGVALTANSTNYVHYDPVTHTVISTVAPPGPAEILLSTAITDGVGIRFLHKTRNVIYQPSTTLHNYLLTTRRIAWTSGLATAVGSGPLKLDVNAGTWYVATELISAAGGADVTFSYFYGAGGATEVPGQTDLSNTQYDNAGVLAAMTPGWYRADTVVITSDNRISIFYGTAEYALQTDAESTTNRAPIPDFLSPTGCYTALVVVQQGGAIASIVDIRPNPNAATAGGGGAATNDHSALLNLGADDHIQYLLVNGTRAMSGNLDMGGNDVDNVGLVDGVDVSAHASRHNPGGADALATAIPVAIQVGAAPSEGAGAAYAKDTHQHGIGVGAPSSVGTSNQTGTASTVSASDHVHDHGAQIEPTHHAVATGANNGFMSATDKTKLDLLAAASASDAAGSVNTASLVDVLMSGMTQTPVAGTYEVWFGADVSNNTANQSVYANIYVGGVKVAASERPFFRGPVAARGCLTCLARVTVTGVEAIEGRWRVSGGTGDALGRQLHVVRVQ